MLTLVLHTGYFIKKLDPMWFSNLLFLFENITKTNILFLILLLHMFILSYTISDHLYVRINLIRMILLKYIKPNNENLREIIAVYVRKYL